MQAADDVRLETRAMVLRQLERAPGSSGQGSGKLTAERVSCRKKSAEKGGR